MVSSPHPPQPAHLTAEPAFNPPSPSTTAPQTMATLKAQKSALRALLKTRLSALPPSAITAQSAALTSTLLSFPPYLSARRISIFLSMPGPEVQTAELVRHALASGKEVFVPWLYATTESDRGRDGYLPKRAMDMVRLRDVADFEGLGRDAWGIPTVEDGEGRERLVGREAGGNGDGNEDGNGNGNGNGKGEVVKGVDLVLLPGVAFQKLEGEKAVRRLGHGKGFYDFFLRRYGERYGEGIRLFGLALREQVLDGLEGEVPMGEHDCLLHGIVVDDGEVVE